MQVLNSAKQKLQQCLDELIKQVKSGMAVDFIHRLKNLHIGLGIEFAD